MKKSILFYFLFFTGIACFANEPIEIKNIKDVFEKYNVEGSILLYNQNDNIYMGYNLDRCNISFCPASTFKIPNTLIALESSAVTTNTIFKWDGKKRSMRSWEKDMNITEAFKVSCVPVYQEIARRIGTERMNNYIRLFNYGNMDIHPENIDKFWLEGNSEITQYQQIYFLHKLYNLQLPVSEKAISQIKQIMIQEKTDTYSLSGKTGWAIR